MRFLILALILSSLSSCSALRSRLHKTTSTDEVEAPAAPGIVGTIEMVNPEAKFVIVKLAPGQSVKAETLLVSTSSEGRIAKLKVTPERKGMLVTADITEGEPTAGDAVAMHAVQPVAAAADNTTPLPQAPPPTDATDGRAPTISISPVNAGPAPLPSTEGLRIVPPTPIGPKP